MFIYNIHIFIVIPCVVIPPIIIFAVLSHYNVDKVFNKYGIFPFCIFIAFSIYCLLYFISFLISFTNHGTYEGRENLTAVTFGSTIIVLGYLLFIIYKVAERLRNKNTNALTRVLLITAIIISITVVAFYTLQFSNFINSCNNDKNNVLILKSDENLPTTPSQMSIEIDSLFVPGSDIAIMLDNIDPAATENKFFYCVLKSETGKLLADYGIAETEGESYVSWYDKIPYNVGGKCYVYICGNGEVVRQEINI